MGVEETVMCDGKIRIQGVKRVEEKGRGDRKTASALSTPATKRIAPSAAGMGKPVRDTPRMLLIRYSVATSV